MLPFRKSLFVALVATSALLAQHARGATTDSSAAFQATESPTGAPTGAPLLDDDEPGGSMTDCNPDFIGDGACDALENTEACGYDGGDCCECTCEPGPNNCGGSYNCIDPEAECVDDDDGDGGALTTVDLEDEGIGNQTDDDSASGTALVASSLIVGCVTAIGFAALAL